MVMKKYTLIVYLLCFVLSSVGSSNGNDVEENTKVLMSLAVDAAKAEKYDEAKQYFERILNVDSNNVRAIRGIANLDGLLGDNPDNAVRLYSRAINLGDKESLRLLAGLYIKEKRYDDLRALVPLILKEKASNINYVEYLVICAAKFKDVDLFFQALDGVSRARILSDPDLLQICRLAGKTLAVEDAPSFKYLYQQDEGNGVHVAD